MTVLLHVALISPFFSGCYKKVCFKILKKKADFYLLQSISILMPPKFNLDVFCVLEQMRQCREFAFWPLCGVLTWFLAATMMCSGAAEALFIWTFSVSVLRPG